MAELIDMPFELCVRMGPRNRVRWDPDPLFVKGQFWGKGMPIVKYSDFLPWAVPKWLNRLICRVGCGFRWAEGSTCSIVFARWRQWALMGGHIGAPWQTQLNCLSALAVWPYGKLLWPLVMYVAIEVLYLFKF